MATEGREYGWDDTIKEDAQEFEPLPEGDYNVTIEKFDRSRSSGNGKLPACNMAVVYFIVHVPNREITIRENYPANDRIYFNDDDDDHITELSPDGTRTNYLTVDGGIVGGDAALLISAGSSSRIQFYDSFSDDGEDAIKLQGNLEVRGTKSRVARTENFSDRLLYCYETPTPMFGDLGCGKTNDRGIAIVDIDPAFSETINSGIEYQVFLQKEEDGDIWIEEKDTEYFMVKGTPNLKFSWELKCIQKHYEHLRLDEKEVQEAAQKDNRDAKKDYDIIIDTVVEDYDKEMEELINESN